MTILHDDGLYRHLLFQRPTSSAYWFEVVTWPGSLAVRGDMGSYQFSGTTDILALFNTGHEVDPVYWSEKLGAGRGSVREYDEGVAKTRIDEAVADWLVDLGFGTDLEPIDPEEFGPVHNGYGAARAAAGRLVVSVRDVLLSALHDETLLRQALEAFRAEDRAFADTWEWDFHAFSFPFLWTCHALQWAAGSYVRYRVDQPVLASAGAEELEGIGA